jgi:hypothetical protein
VIAGDHYSFTVQTGKPKNLNAVEIGTKLARGANFRCLISGVPIGGDYIKSEGKAESRSRLSEQILRVDKWSVLPGLGCCAE